MNDRQLFICANALFDDGWSYEAIAKALSVSREEIDQPLLYRRGDDPELVWERYSVKDKDGNAIVRDDDGNIVERVPPPTS